jgi:hypothetical protein
MSCRYRLLRERSQYARSQVWHEYMRNGEVLTSAVIGSGVLVGAVLLTLSTPYLRRGIGEEDGGSSSQCRSSVGKHVVMFHNSTI